MSSLQQKIELRSSDQLRNEVVLIPSRLNQDDLDCLGLSLHAIVSSAGGKFVAYRPPSLERELKREDADWIKSQSDSASNRILRLLNGYEGKPIEGMLHAFQLSKSEHDNNSSKEIDVSGLNALEVTPAGRLLAETLRSMPLSSWSQVRQTGSTVFSSLPVMGEKPLPINEKAWDTYLKSQTELAEWAKGYGSRTLPINEAWILPRSRPLEGSHTVLLIVNRIGFVPTFTIEIFNKDGDEESDSTCTSDGYRQTKLSKPSDKSLGTINLSANVLREISAPVPGTSAFKLEYLNPSVHEPLDYSVRLSLITYAKARGFSKVIGCIPDELLGSIQSCLVVGSLNLDMVRRVLDLDGLEELSRGQTLVILPRLPLQEEARRIDRVPITDEFLAASRGEFTLTSLLKVHHAFPDLYETSFLKIEQSRMQNAFGLEAVAGWNASHEILTALGDLSAAELERLTSDGQIRLTFIDHPVAISAFSKFVAANSAELTDPNSFHAFGAVDVKSKIKASALSLQASRISANSDQLLVHGVLGVFTLVERVSKGHAAIRTFDPDKGNTVREGDNLILDSSYKPLSVIFPQRLSNKVLYQKLLDSYNYVWIQQRGLSLSFDSTSGLGIGPITIRGEIVDRSKAPVPFSEVPGLLQLSQGSDQATSTP